jgi:hypothetical protein
MWYPLKYQFQHGKANPKNRRGWIMRFSKFLIVTCFLFLVSLCPSASLAWFDETHLAIAKVAGYEKWFNAAGPDIAKLKLGDKEGDNHFVNNPKGTVVTPEMILAQVERYNHKDPTGHLYGAIIASARDYIESKRKGRYAEYHIAYCAHYIGDLSQPLHNTLYSDYNKRNHGKTDGVINEGILDNPEAIKVYPIEIKSETDLAREIARIANLSMALGYKLEDEGRLLSKEEAYQQVSHSASLFRAVLGYVGEQR